MQQFLTQDKLGKPLSIEFTTIDPLSPQFSETLNSISDSLSRAYVPVEVQFARKFPHCLSTDKFLHSIESFFKDGVDNVKWSQVEETVKEVLRQFFSHDFPKSFAANKEMSSNFSHFFIIAKDKASMSSLGAIYCLTSKTDHENIIRVPIFGVSPEAQSRGIGKLLMSAILKCIPSTKKIALSTRITNERAINAYHAWGFVPSPNTMECWANMEYAVGLAKGLLGFSVGTEALLMAETLSESGENKHGL